MDTTQAYHRTENLDCCTVKCNARLSCKENNVAWLTNEINLSSSNHLNEKQDI